MKSIFVLVLAIGFVSASIRNDYDGYKVFRIYPEKQNQRNLVQDLRNEGQFDFWSELNKLDRGVDIMVEPGQISELTLMMKQFGIRYEVLIEDVQRKLNNQFVDNIHRSINMTWNKYHSLELIYDWLDHLGETQDNVEVITAGHSYNGINQKGIKISYRGNRNNVIIEGGTHSREWISPATVTYLINELIFSQDETVRNIARAFDWYIFPVTNPDGYVYSTLYTRLWSKTRTDYSHLCPGVNPDRNFDFHYGVGTSTFPCNYLYCGPEVSSEQEVKNFAKFIESIGSKTDVYLSFRNYGQILFFPYGISSERMENYEDLYTIGKAAIDAIPHRYGTEYTLGSYSEIWDEDAGGIGMDWAVSKMKIPLAFTYMMRDLGQSSYLLDPKYIIPNCLEMMDSLKAMFLKAEELGYFKL